MRTDQDESRDGLFEDFKRLGAELGRDVRERDRDGAFGHGDWKRAAEHGVQGLLVPELYGGSGRGPAEYVRVMEGLGYGCADNGLFLALGAHILAVEMPLVEFGTADQHRAYLPALAGGQAVGANAMTEPTTGSDALALATRAERDGDGYVLNGLKRYVTNAPVADLFVVYATVAPALGFTGVTAFLVERGDAGLAVREGEEKLGLRTAAWGEVELTDCRIPDSRRLGAEKQGSGIFARTMAWERALILAPWLGVMQREIDECIGYARRRRQFGRHIGHFQAVAHRLVDMRIRWEIARLTTYRAAAGLADGEPGIFPELNKLYTSEAAVEVCSQALQIHGALGYTGASRAGRNLRDAIGMTISSGTSDMQRNIIAGRLGLAWPERDADGSGPWPTLPSI
jgi:alkylation response protein AidB-like acyl-CoA dehydrogenase